MYNSNFIVYMFVNLILLYVRMSKCVHVCMYTNVRGIMIFLCLKASVILFIFFFDVHMCVYNSKFIS